MRETKVTLVEYQDHFDLHIGYHIPDSVFLSGKPTLITRFDVDNVYLRIYNNNDHA